MASPASGVALSSGGVDVPDAVADSVGSADGVPDGWEFESSSPRQATANSEREATTPTRTRAILILSRYNDAIGRRVQPPLTVSPAA
jgi:hypothetical protein